MDYCNSLLYGISSSLLSKLQLVQNTAARIVTKTRKYDHITPVLARLHWLPVHSRIVYKLLLLTYKALNDLAPGYIRELLNVYMPKRSNMRSASKYLLQLPWSRLVSCGDRSFAVAAPILWNALPQDIRNATTIACFKS